MAKYMKTEQGYIEIPNFALAPFKPEGKSYLTFSSPNNFTLAVENRIKNWNGTLEYFASDKTWTTWDGTSALSAVADDGEYVLYLRGTGNTVITGNDINYKWVLTGTDIACVGNIENLLDYTTVESGAHPTMANYCYSWMFQGCTALTQAPSLPATTLAVSCYSRMFQDCAALTQAPSLPATTLAVGCYNLMFWRCTALTHAPSLPATTLANDCYSRMFQGCTALTQAPSLPATTLANDCYSGMFQGCTALTQAPSLPATTLAVSCYSGMFQGCTALTHVPSLPATTLANYCYNGMFQDCTALTQATSLPATTLANDCYIHMFQGCTSLKLSSTKIDEYTQEYRIPFSGNGTTATYALIDMFASTGGTFNGTPSINTTYYLSSDNMIVRETELATLNGYVDSMINNAVPELDTTLSIAGKSADAKATGDAIRALSDEIVTTSESKVAAHNTGTDTHSDIRLLIQGLTDRLNALADSDDTTLDQLSEVMAYIKNNRSLIEAITTNKVSVADIVDNLTTNVSNKPLSAAQGVVIKTLIDALRNDKQDKATLEADISAAGFTKNAGTYSKPTGGIPKADLAEAVQTSLGKADTSLQEHQSLAAYRTAAAQDVIDSGKVDKVTGKGLSSNDYTAAAKAKVDAIPANPKYTDTVYDDTALKKRVSTIEGKESAWDAKSDFSGSYNDLTDKPTILTIPEYVRTEAETVARIVNQHQSNDSIIFPFLADAHCGYYTDADNKATKLAGQFLSLIGNRVPFDFIANGGDMANGAYDTTKEMSFEQIEDYTELVSDAHRGVPAVWVPGNHDDSPYMATADRATQKDVFALIGRKNRISGAVCPNGCNYGYLDLENRKLRVIYLDTDDKRSWGTIAVGAGETAPAYLNAHNVGGAQLQWLANMGLDFTGKTNPAEWSIVVVSHVALNISGTITDAVSGTVYTHSTENAAKILNAYRTGKSGSITHNGVTINYDFSTVGSKAAVICAVHGHNHKFCTETLTGGILSIGCPNVMNGRERASDDGNTYTKTAGTADGTSFCILTIDRENCVIYVDCVGAGYDREFTYTTEVAAYTNQIPISTNTDGSVYGYQAGYRLGSSGTPSGQNGSYITGFIPVSVGDTVYMKNVTFKYGVDNGLTSSNQRISFYNASKAHIVQTNATGLGGVAGGVKGDDGIWTQFTPKSTMGGVDCSGVAYFRINAAYIGDDSIITVNEPIE